MTDLVLHGHFYQPPRENPWTSTVEREPSAHPDHNWNERIWRECYRANAFARVFDGYGRVERIVDNYEYLSFNFGPTLLSWLEHHDLDTYRKILEADRRSARRNHGHGNAIAQGYNHAILPLCSDRDRRTQVRWGITDFRYRFGRQPEALWLPETACNHATLDLLIDEGMRYAILSPYQAQRVRSLSGGGWRDVSHGDIDPGHAYVAYHRDGSGRSIALFFYDGPISRSLAFEGSLTSSQALVARLRQAQGGLGRLVHIATDGESYGHHTRHGERALAHALIHEAKQAGFSITNYGAYLDRHPPVAEVEIKAGPNGEGTAWSCAHGVGRWYRDCGCSGGAREGWNQGWRGPLRAALDLLRDHVAGRFEETRGILFSDPWDSRDRYLELLFDPEIDRDAWLEREAGRALRPAERDAALAHLELQRCAQLMYTSCGWFFADISGIETVQVMKYAQRVIDLADELDLQISRDAFLDRLADAQSNLREMGNGADVFRRFVEPMRIHPGRIAAHIAVTSLVDDRPTGTVAGCRFQTTAARKLRHGRLSVATMRIELVERATGRLHELAVAAMHFGGVDFYCLARPFAGAHRFTVATTRLWSQVRTATLPTILRVAQAEFGPDEYGLESLLPEGRRQIARMVFGDIINDFTDQYARLYESNQRVLEMLQEIGFELPGELLAAAELTFRRRFEEAIRRAAGSRDPELYAPAVGVAEEAARRGYTIDRTGAAQELTPTLAAAVTAALADPSTAEQTAALAEIARTLGLDASLERAQELIDEACAADVADPRLRGLRRAVGLVAIEPIAMREVIG